MNFGKFPQKNSIAELALIEVSNIKFRTFLNKLHNRYLQGAQGMIQLYKKGLNFEIFALKLTARTS